MFDKKLEIIALAFAGLLSACTDYVQNIDNQYNEWLARTGTVEASLSSSTPIVVVSSSSTILQSSPSVVSDSKLVDARDGQVYKTVTISNQVWMAENLNFDASNSYCYNDNQKYCPTYGRLYTWAAAMDSAGAWSQSGKGCGHGKSCTQSENIRGVCPEGWHLPTIVEWSILFIHVGGGDPAVAGKMLKSRGYWNSVDGLDAYGFMAIPAGLRYYSGNYREVGCQTYFWSSTQTSNYNANGVNFGCNSDAATTNNQGKNNGFSVRCIKD